MIIDHDPNERPRVLQRPRRVETYGPIAKQTWHDWALLMASFLIVAALLYIAANVYDVEARIAALREEARYLHTVCKAELAMDAAEEAFKKLGLHGNFAK